MAVPKQFSFPQNADYRLFVYAAIVADTDFNLYVKFGDTRCVTVEDAINYVFEETLGKARGVMQEKDLIGIWDITEYAIRQDSEYNPTLPIPKKGFDNVIRNSVVPYRKVLRENLQGTKSYELHPIPKQELLEKNWREHIKHHMNERIEKLNKNGLL
jgi:hypothetical protein